MCEVEGSYWLEMFERIGLLNICPSFGFIHTQRIQVFVEPQTNILLIFLFYATSEEEL